MNKSFMNSKQRRSDFKYRIKTIKFIAGLLTDYVKEWKDNPNIAKEDIIEELESIIEITKEGFK